MSLKFASYKKDGHYLKVKGDVKKSDDLIYIFLSIHENIHYFNHKFTEIKKDFLSSHLSQTTHI